MKFLFGDDPGSSFFHLLQQQLPALLPSLEMGATLDGAVSEVPRGTTILALRYREGVVVAGDRQAVEGFQVASRTIEKVYKADEHSAIAIAGVAGPCLELAKLFQTELAHYEKLEGAELSMEGKANKLAQMVKANLPAAIKGLIVIPIFVGYDLRKGEGKIYKYDLTGGLYEEAEYYATGSGGKDARATMKKLYRRDMNEEQAIRVALEALYDAAEEDLGTAGPDFVRGIFPTVKVVVKEGIRDVHEERIKSIFEVILKEKRGG